MMLSFAVGQESSRTSDSATVLGPKPFRFAPLQSVMNGAPESVLAEPRGISAAWHPPPAECHRGGHSTRFLPGDTMEQNSIACSGEECIQCRTSDSGTCGGILSGSRIRFPTSYVRCSG